MPKKETAADRVIDAYSGAYPCARRFKISPSTVFRWRYPKSMGGTDGEVPNKYHKGILKDAKKGKHTLTAADLVNV